MYELVFIFLISFIMNSMQQNKKVPIGSVQRTDSLFLRTKRLLVIQTCKISQYKYKLCILYELIWHSLVLAN